MSNLKACPACQERQAATRRKCRKCGHIFTDVPARPKPAARPKNAETPTPEKPGIVTTLVAFLCVFGLIYGVFVWKSNVEREKRIQIEQQARDAKAAQAEPTPKPTARPNRSGLNQGEAIYAVRSYLREMAYVPESIHVQEWGELLEDTDGTYLQPCRWSWKSKAGLEIFERKTFHISASGVVLEVFDL